MLYETKPEPLSAFRTIIQKHTEESQRPPSVSPRHDPLQYKAGIVSDMSFQNTLPWKISDVLLNYSAASDKV